MGRLLGYTREAAARYSFLLAMPAVFASGLYKVYRVAVGGNSVDVGPTVVATLIAFGVGYAVIVWFLKLVSTKSYQPFVIYRIVISIVIGLLLAGGILSPMGTAVM